MLLKKFLFIIFILVYPKIYSQIDINSYVEKVLRFSNHSQKIDIDHKLFDYHTSLNKSKFLPQVSLSFTAPGYGRSITPIQQPDGSKIFREQNNALTSLSVSIDQIIPLTGGTLNIANSINRIDLFGDNNRTSYSASWLNVSYSQPLNFFNPYKWEKKINSLNEENQNNQFLFSIEKLKLNAIETYFDTLISQIHYNSTISEIDNAKLNLEITKELFDLKEASKIDVIDSNIFYSKKKKDSILELNKLKLYKKKLSDLAGDDNFLDLLVIPNQPIEESLSIEFCIELYLKNNFRIKENYELEKSKMEVSSKAATKLLNASLNLSLGFNNSQEGFSSLFRDASESNSANLSLSIPILNWKKSKIEYDISLKNHDLKKIELDDLRLTNKYEITELVNTLNLNRELLSLNKEKHIFYELKYSDAKELFLKKEMSIDEFDKVELSYVESLHEKIDLLRSLWVSYYKLRSITLFDFHNHTNLSGQ